MESVLIAGIISAAMSATSYGESQQQIAHTDDRGMQVETRIGPYMPALHAESSVSTRAEILWHVNDTAAIANSMCLADTADETWIGWNLNYERLAYLQTNGSGTPIYEYDLVPKNPNNVVVASAEDTSLGVVMYSTANGPVTILGFDDSSGTIPLWTYTFDSGYATCQFYAVDVAADGSIVIAAAYISGQSQSMIVILDGLTGTELDRQVTATYVTAVELSDDGSRAVLTESATARIIDTTTMSDLFSFSVSGGGSKHRISRNGLVAAAGGFNFRAFRDTGSGWTQVYSGSEASQWFGGIGLSGDGNTLFSVSHNYAAGYLILTYRVIDLVAGTELTRITTSGTGSYQDTVQRAEVSQDGQTLACISWGTQDNVHPEVQAFDRDLNLIGSIDMPGSPFSLDLSRDGRHLVAGGKHVHANEMGSGGDTYAYSLALPCPADLTGDDVVNIDDIFAVLGLWGDCPDPCPPYCDGDLTEDCTVNIDDIFAILGQWGPCN